MEELILTLALFGGGRAECVRFRPIVTSEISVQVYTIGSWAGEVMPRSSAALYLQRSGSGFIASGKTDDRGYFRFDGISPGRYTLQVEPFNSPIVQDLHVLKRGSGPKRLVAVLTGFPCTQPCVVDASEAPLVKPPACLFARRK